MTKTQIIILGSVGAVIIVFALIFLGILPGLKNTAPPVEPPKTELNIWGLSGEESAWAEVITGFAASNPNILVKYTGVDEARYETFLIDSLAANTGPDIFLLHNDWLAKHKNKILAAPEALLNPERVLEIFPKVVSDVFVEEGKVYALPISINTLALAYNRDIYDAKQVSIVPDGWADIKGIIPRLREIKDGRIVKEAISLGGSRLSVANAPDILTLLMLQFGASRGEAFAGSQGLASGDLLSALKFYMDFSDPKSPNYTLDESFKNSLDAFAEGSSAMVLVYPDDIQYIKGKSQLAFSNLKILPMPQVDSDNPVNLTSFWGLAVSNKTSKYDLAWNFINFATTNQTVVDSYATISGNSPALRSAINDFKDHPVLKVFAPQILNAKTYPKQKEAEARAVFDDMIKSALRDRTNLKAIANEALSKISSLNQ